MDEYIKGSEKFPLEQSRWGFLPLNIQKFLQTDNKKCYITGSKELKENHVCFLTQKKLRKIFLNQSMKR